MKKKMSLLLILTLLMSLLPVNLSVLAAESNIQLVQSPLYGGITTGSVIYFGQYTKNDNNKAPIQWRVMGVEDGKATLMSEYILEYRWYDASTHNKWSGSEICNYLNNDFLTIAFNTVEQDYIVTYSNIQEKGYKTTDTFTPNQKIVLPSVNEVQDGGDFAWKQDSDRQAQNAEGYRGSRAMDKAWWLRSPGGGDIGAAYVRTAGTVSDQGTRTSQNYGVRPALKLNLSSVLFTSDASGTEAKTGTPDSRLNSVADTNNEKKLTLIDTASQNIDIASDTYKYIDNQATEIEINYSNATIGTNQYLSAMITDNSGTLKYYGPIKSLTADASGTARVTIPQEFEEDWKLQIFTEQLNPDYQTDYASVPVEVTLQKVPDVLPQVSKGDKLYFGQYTKRDNNKAPILWRVMEKDVLSETVTLMSEHILEYRPYDPSTHNNWSGSDICNYLNSDFLMTVFTLREQGYIATYSNVQEHGNLEDNTFIPNQKIVLPSINEVQEGGDFGWSQNSDRKAENVEGYIGTPFSQMCWWLRSPGGYNSGAAYVYDLGNVSNRGAYVYRDLGVRPTLKLNLSSVLFTAVTVKAPAALTNVPNGISIEDLKSQLPTTVSAIMSDSTEDLTISWDFSTISYNPNLKEEQTFSIPGKIGLPEGVVKLSEGITPNINISVTVDAPVAPTITTTSLSSGTVGVAYSQTLAATGDSPIIWSIESGTLPQGLNLSGTTGAISGTPTTVGTSNFTVKAANGVNPDATKALSITINTTPVVTYTVTFDSNGGSVVAPISSVTNGSTITLPIPTRLNYIFKGWFEGNNQYTNTTPITKDVSLVAKWEQNTSGGGSSGGGNSSTPVPSVIVEQVINQLSQKDKEAILQNFKEHMPYTSLRTELVLEQLKKFTSNKFTDSQLKELLDKPELLRELGIDESMLSTFVGLKTIKNASFTDVLQTHWASESIKQAAELGLVAGMPDGSFLPNSPLQVADTLTFLDRVLLLNGVTEMKLSRITVEKYITDKKHWAFSSMASIGSKLSEETLKAVSELGDKPFSRELLAQVLYEITEGKLDPVREEIAFEDIADSPYKDALNYCVRVGLLYGIDSSHMVPTKVLTRAELMSVLIRLNNKLK